MTRIVNRVPTLRKPSRARHHYRLHTGPHKMHLAYALASGYNPDTWHIPDDPFDATSWLTSVHGEETHQ